ncbi:hypothetical protein HanXRQr2_Chr17g0789221 [Helianthus annuus]|uniref:Uncharacterized protein n=1 Tax=Helianthus annuus TaxID=4232 RepID=A0A251RNW8_HELAN|nr:hypothetical protein HanXRQr2_Chr17g0789221 [Helianthus annuus]KAJ0432227.1 hypothetical protein HanIR_Chr17g0856921 [Helianthus annuus]
MLCRTLGTAWELAALECRACVKLLFFRLFVNVFWVVHLIKPPRIFINFIYYKTAQSICKSAQKSFFIIFDCLLKHFWAVNTTKSPRICVKAPKKRFIIFYRLL